MGWRYVRFIFGEVRQFLQKMNSTWFQKKWKWIYISDINIYDDIINYFEQLQIKVEILVFQNPHLARTVWQISEIHQTVIFQRVTVARSFET